MEISKNNKRIYYTLAIVVVILAMIMGLNIFIDPFFHYHKNLSFLNYSLTNEVIEDPGYFERYYNNGMVRNLEYNAIITGTSMSENFKTSELDKLFNTHSIKVCYSGASYREINDNLEMAIKSNPETKMVIRSIDCIEGVNFFLPADQIRRDDEEYAGYLYNNNPFDDVKYFFNKDVVFFSGCILKNTIRNGENMNFDEYANWMELYPNFGAEYVKQTYNRQEKTEMFLHLTQTDVKAIENNIYTNIIIIAKNNPNIEFFYFFPPYSIYWWDDLNQTGNLCRWIDAFQLVTEMLNDIPNIHLFGFFNNTDMICNMDNYKDYIHYGEWINSFILKSMKDGDYELTTTNRKEYYDTVRKFYTSYDYDALFE